MFLFAAVASPLFRRIARYIVKIAAATTMAATNQTGIPGS